VDRDLTKEHRVSYNAGFLIRPSGGVAGVALKNHLLMFGEYLPFEDRFPSLRKRFPHAGDLRPGTRPAIFRWGTTNLGMAICYEDLIPEFVRHLAQKNAHVIVNITNDSWFGKSREPAQHLALAALRSVEVRKAMIRATNTGISAVIDPAGRITIETPIFKRAVFIKQVPLLKGKTLFVRLGPWLVYLCLFGVLATLLQRALSRNNRGKVDHM
jgi:apolipoprotein N-acyltransferase